MFPIETKKYQNKLSPQVVSLCSIVSLWTSNSTMS